MKLSKKDRRELESALFQLMDGYKYLMSKEVLVMRPEQTKQVYRSDQFQNPKTGEVVCGPMEKEIGSKLCNLESGICRLRNILNEDKTVSYKSALGPGYKETTIEE